MVPPVHDLHTGRLVLRQLTTADAPFMVQLLNEPSWLRYIGDRGVRTAEDAVRYIETGPRTMYCRYGLGLYHVGLAATGQSVGVCGLLKRESLEDVDLGSGGPRWSPRARYGAQPWRTPGGYREDT